MRPPTIRLRPPPPADAPQPAQKIGCPKCGALSGDSWTQCGGFCPIPASPHYHFSTEVEYGR